MNGKKRALLKALYFERAELFRRSKNAYMQSRETGEMSEDMFSAIKAGGLCEEMIQHVVGCSCKSTGAAECGGMEYHESSDSLTGTPCDCVCHDMCMARPSEESRKHVEEGGFVGMTLLRIMDDKFSDW